MGRKWPVLVGLVVVIVVVIGLFALVTDDEEGGGGPGTGQGGTVELEDIIRQQDDYLGRTVTVNGDVVAIIERGAFTIGNEGGDELLVLARDAAGGEDVREGESVTVRGQVILVDADVLDDAGFDPEEERFGAFERRASVEANTITAGGG